MSIQDTDLMVVNNGTTVETITFAQFRDGTVLNDSDLFLINGGTQAETITWGEIKDEVGGAKPINPNPDQITANPDFQGGTGTELDPYILAPVEVRGAGGMVTSVEQLTVQVDPGVQLVTFTDNSVGAGDRFVQPTQATDENGSLVTRLIYRDRPDSTDDTEYTGNIQVGEVHFRWRVTQLVNVDTAPVIDRVTLAENNPGKDPRFTDQSFNAEIFMDPEGQPVSTKIWDAYVEGRMSVQDQFKAPLEGTSTSTVDYASTATVDNGPAGQFTELGTIANCFDGNAGTSYALQATSVVTALEQTWTFSASPVAGGRALGVKFYANNPVQSEGRLKSGGKTINDNGSGYFAFNVPEGDELVGLYFKYVPQGNNVPLWGIYTFEDVPPGTITSIPENSLIDGDLTVLQFAADTDFSTLEDGDIVSQMDGDVIYSDARYWSSTVNMSGTVPSAFDGSTATFALGPTNTNGTFTFNPPTDLSNAQNIRVYCAQGVSVNLYGDAGKSSGFAAAAGWVEFIDDNPNINRIEVVGNASSGVGRVMFAAIEDNGVILVDATEITGVVKEIAEPNVTLTAETTGWINGLDVTGPTREVIKDNVKKYLSFSTTGNVQDLIDAPQDPPVFGTNQLTFTFPSTFPSGQTPDEELGEGTTFTVSATAFNTAGASGPIEATVQPSIDLDQFAENLVSHVDGESTAAATWSNYLNGNNPQFAFDGVTSGSNTCNSSNIIVWDLVASGLTADERNKIMTADIVVDTRFNANQAHTVQLNGAFGPQQNVTSTGTELKFNLNTLFGNTNLQSIGIQCQLATTHIIAWYINGQIVIDNQGIVSEVTELTFDAGADFTFLEAGDTLTQGAVSGTVGSIAAPVVTLTDGTTGWVDGQEVIGPDKTPIRSLTEDELTAQKLKFGTYENRSAVYQGEQAMAQREALAKELQEKGIDASEVLETKAKRGRRKKAD